MTDAFEIGHGNIRNGNDALIFRQAEPSSNDIIELPGAIL